MKRILYLLVSFFIASLVAAMAGWSIAAGNLLVPIVAIPLGVIVILACRANVDEVIADERERRIRARAALRTLEVVIIGGAVAAIILYSFLVSGPLTPVITGKVVVNDDGSRSLKIAQYQPGALPGPETQVRQTTITDLDSMNETEALAYASYIREGFSENEDRGLAGITIGVFLVSMLGIFGAFYLYYGKMY